MKGGRSSRDKGNRGEREVVNTAIDHGLTAERAFGSNGRALGRVEGVDVLVNDLGFQVKRYARIADYLHPAPGVDGVLIRRDHGPWLAVLPYDTLLDMLKGTSNGD